MDYASLRPIVMRLYNEHVANALGRPLPNVGSADELRALAQRLRPPAFEAEHGWRTEPPFPGAMEKPEQMSDGWRAIGACRLFEGENELGVIFMTFYGGRPAGAFLGTPGTAIPEEYSVLTSR
jgi:hypothetical protein